MVDNVFATPIFQKPLKLGADIVVYSATKHIDGQGRVLGGAILGDDALLDEAYKDPIRHTGPALSPFNAWVLLKGLDNPGPAGPRARARPPPAAGRRHRRAPQGEAGAAIPAGPTTRSTRSRRAR